MDRHGDLRRALIDAGIALASDGGPTELNEQLARDDELRKHAATGSTGIGASASCTR